MFNLASTESTKIRPVGFERPAVEPQELPASVLVRRAAASDQRRISVLARLDDRRLPGGPYLVAEEAGELVAALSLPTGALVADPFRRTRNAGELLRLRAEQLTAADGAAAAATERPALWPLAA